MNEYIPDLLFDWIIEGHEVRWAYDAANFPAGDICFFLSYGKIVDKKRLMQHRNNLVVHASDLLKGRGWSPLTWQIIEGKEQIPVTIFEAGESSDSGPIYEKTFVSFSSNELIEELRCGLANAIVDLCRNFISRYPHSVKLGLKQESEPSFYPHRGPEDSKIDIQKSLLSQFNLLSMVDNNKCPAWFELKGCKFFLKSPQTAILMMKKND